LRRFAGAPTSFADRSGVAAVRLFSSPCQRNSALRTVVSSGQGSTNSNRSERSQPAPGRGHRGRGKRIWDQNGKFELSVGPLTFKQFINLLPLGRGFTPLCDLTRFYVGDQHDFSFNLKLKSSEVPAAILSRNSGPRLSWTAWLRTKASTQSEV